MEPLFWLAWFIPLAVVVGAYQGMSLGDTQCTAPKYEQSPNFFQHKIAGLSYDVIDFGDLRGNVVLAVNVATFSMHTRLQYKQLNALLVKYGKEYPRFKHPYAPRCYLAIVGFPCNQFGLLEPAHNDEILNILKYVRPGHGFVPNFNLTTKIEVNGENENEIFTFLKSRCPPPGGIVSRHPRRLCRPIWSNDMSWNFQKWLIDSEGHPWRHYDGNYTPNMVEKDIIRLIDECARNKLSLLEP